MGTVSGKGDMMKKTRIIAVVICAVLLLCGCNTSDSDTTSAQTEADTFSEVAYPDMPSPLSVDGVQISYDEYRYYFNGIKYQYDGGYDDFWTTADDEVKQTVKEKTLNTIKQNLAVRTLAAQYGVTVTDDQLSEIDEAVAMMKSQFETEAEYYRYLDSMHLTEAVNDILARDYYLRANLYEYMIGDESGNIINPLEDKVRKFIANYMICADRIFISKDYGDDVNEIQTLLDLIKSKLDAGEDFNEIKKQYSEDTSTSDNLAGVYFYKGDYDDYYYNAALELKEGETSDIVSTPVGYMIIKRYPHDEEYITEHLEDEFNNSYCTHMFSFAIEKEIAKQNVVTSDSYDEIDVSNIK